MNPNIYLGYQLLNIQEPEDQKPISAAWVETTSRRVYGVTVSALDQVNLISNLRNDVAILSLDISNIKESLKKIEINFSVQLYDLDDLKYKLKSPIWVLITKEQDYYIAESVDFDVYGTGETEKEAISELKETLINFYENLMKEKKITKELEVKKRLLTKLISSK